MKPRIAITMGDPGGIGPEVIVKSLSLPDVRSLLSPVIYGHLDTLRSAAAAAGSPIKFAARELPDGEPLRADAIPVVESPTASPWAFRIGAVSAANGHASYAAIVAAAQAALAGEVDAICTAPIAKEALFAAGYTVPGHTELLALQCGRDTVRMMLVGGGLRVVLQTIHVALSQVPSLLTPESILTSLEIIQQFAKGIGEPTPRIAVCGLNPHAGEAGHFGDEEPRLIEPAIAAAHRQEINVAGPLPADTVFHRALQREFDFVLAMYHDQGLIPVKTLDFNGGVNTTLGLPLLRTSPDHGTAFNIAGQGIADPGSMISALKYAAYLATMKSGKAQEM